MQSARCVPLHRQVQHFVALLGTTPTQRPPKVHTPDTAVFRHGSVSRPHSTRTCCSEQFLSQRPSPPPTHWSGQVYPDKSSRIGWTMRLVDDLVGLWGGRGSNPRPTDLRLVVLDTYP
jgi:hypothetical protein